MSEKIIADTVGPSAVFEIDPVANDDFSTQPKMANLKELTKQEKTEDKIRRFSREWLINFYETGSEKKYFYSCPDLFGSLKTSLSEISGMEKVDQETFLAIFFEELARFADEKLYSSQEQEVAKVKIFIHNIHFAFFDDLPKFTPRIPNSIKLSFAAWATSHPELGAELVDKVSSYSSFMLKMAEDKDWQGIAERISNEPLEKILDTIHLLKTFGAQGVETIDSLKDPLYVRAKIIIVEIKRRVNLPLVQYAADLALDFLENAAETSKFHNWRMSKLFYGLPEGRIWEEPPFPVKEDHKTLLGKIYPAKKFQVGPMFQVAKNAVAILDDSMTPRYFLQVKMDSLPAGSERQRREDFIAYNRLAEDVNLNPFGHTSNENLPLLLRYLHRFDLSKKIEGDLGVSLNHLPLRSQIHFFAVFGWARPRGF